MREMRVRGIRFKTRRTSSSQEAKTKWVFMIVGDDWGLHNKVIAQKKCCVTSSGCVVNKVIVWSRDEVSLTVNKRYCCCVDAANKPRIVVWGVKSRCTITSEETKPVRRLDQPDVVSSFWLCWENTRVSVRWWNVNRRAGDGKHRRIHNLITSVQFKEASWGFIWRCWCVIKAPNIK